MKFPTQILILIIMVMLTASCKKTNKSDAYGNFEATETTISAEANGRIIMLNIEEGSVLISRSMREALMACDIRVVGFVAGDLEQVIAAWKSATPCGQRSTGRP